MKKLHFLFLAVLALTLVSCGPSRFTASDVSLASIREFAR